jgi:hypothetical protein
VKSESPGFEIVYHGIQGAREIRPLYHCRPFKKRHVILLVWRLGIVLITASPQCSVCVVLLLYNIESFKFSPFGMSSSFAFVPRIVSKSKKNTGYDLPPLHYVHKPSTHVLHDLPERNGDIRTIAPPGTRGKVKCSDVDYANLISIAVSDYTLWSDPELRRKVDYSGASGADEPTRGGCM